MKTVSSVQKLLGLPECFTDKTFSRFTGLSGESSQVALSRMKSAGLVRSAGNRSGVYYNLIKDREADTKYLIHALLFVYPSAVLSGESVLHNAGWITQIPSAITVCVVERPSYQKIDGVLIEGRPPVWFKTNHSSLLSTEAAGFATYGLKSLPPEKAVVQMFEKPSGLDVDDFDIPEESVEIVQKEFDLAGIDNPFGKSSRHKPRM